jgi:hypothetical protein
MNSQASCDKPNEKNQINSPKNEEAKAASKGTAETTTKKKTTRSKPKVTMVHVRQFLTPFGHA